MAGRSILGSSQDYRNYSEQVDNDFIALKKQAFGDPEEVKRKELERFRQQRDQLGVNKSEEEKLADKFFLEIKYKDENERRAKKELEEIQQTIAQLERSLATAKDIEKKKELKTLLGERTVLFELEKELFSDVGKFRDYYDKLEYDRLSGKQTLVVEAREKLQRMNDIKTKKEQIDYERHRLKHNLEKIKAGDFLGMKRTVSELLQDSEKRRNNNITDFSINPFKYDINNLKYNINSGADKLRGLRVLYLHILALK